MLSVLKGSDFFCNKTYFCLLMLKFVMLIFFITFVINEKTKNGAYCGLFLVLICNCLMMSGKGFCFRRD